MSSLTQRLPLSLLHADVRANPTLSCTCKLEKNRGHVRYALEALECAWQHNLRRSMVRHVFMTSEMWWSSMV